MKTPDIVTNEPVASTGIVVAFIAALIGLLVAFGVPLTEDQKVAILALVGPAAALAGIVARQAVVPLRSIGRGTGKHRRDV